MFGFQTNANITPADHRIKDTIVQIVSNFFEKNKNTALIFVCDQTDNKQLVRHRKFNLWFSSSDNLLITKLDHSICSDDGEVCVYISIMYHCENEKAENIEEAFLNLSMDLDK